jgi:hypothetical protein
MTMIRTIKVATSHFEENSQRISIICKIRELMRSIQRKKTRSVAFNGSEAPSVEAWDE